MKNSPRSSLTRQATRIAAACALFACVTGAEAAPTLKNTIDLSPGTDAYTPYQFGLNASTHKLYVVGTHYFASRFHYGLKVVDTTSGAAIAGVELAASTEDSFDGSFQPIAVAADDSAAPAGNKVYVVGNRFVSGNNPLVLRFVDGATDTNLTDGSTDLVLDGTTEPGVLAANPILVNPVTHKVYVVDGNGLLVVVDGPNRKVLTSFALPVDSAYNAIVNRTTNKIFYFGAGQSSAAIVDGATDAVTPLPVPFYGALGAVLDVAKSRIYVVALATSNQAFTLYALDAASGAVLASSALSGTAPDLMSLAFDATNHVLYGSAIYYTGAQGPTTSFDPATLAVSGTFAHSGDRTVFDAGRLFMIGGDPETPDVVSILNPATGAFTNTTVAYRPAAMAVNSQTGRVYVYDVAANEVPVIDIASGTVIKRFPVIGARDGGAGIYSGGELDSIAVSSAAKRFYRTHVNLVPGSGGSAGQNVLFLDVYDADSGQLVQSVQLDNSGNATNGLIAVDDTHRRVYVSSTSRANSAKIGALFVLDADTNGLLATIDLGNGGYNAAGLAVNPVTRRVYATGGTGAGKLSIVDGASNTLVKVLATSNGHPGRMAFNTKTNMGYIAFLGTANHALDIVDGATDSITGNFNDGSQNPYSTAYNVAVDEATNTVYVLDDSKASDDYTGGVLAFDAGNKYQQIAQIELGDFPTGIAFDSATHRLFVSNIGDGTVSVVQADVPSTLPPFANISTRLKVEKGDNAGIAGFIITGPAGSTKKILIRGRGPSLAQDGVTGTLSDPFLSLRDANGGPPIENDNWQSGDTSQIPAAFQQNISPRDAIIVATLPVGSDGFSNYTAILKGAQPEDTGVGLVELYDLEPGSAPAKAVNIATRGLVQTNDDALFAGIIIGGDNPVNVLLRVTGPSLKNSGISNYLADPMLNLFDGNGNPITSNDNWQDTQAAEISATQLQPNDPLEPAIKVTLSSGLYTAIVRGKGDTIGVAVVEAYKLQ